MSDVVEIGTGVVASFLGIAMGYLIIQSLRYTVKAVMVDG